MRTTTNIYPAILETNSTAAKLTTDLFSLADNLRPVGGKVLIHCGAGISRSAAAAMIIYACWLGPGREQEAMEKVL